MFSVKAGADIICAILELLIYPAIYMIWRGRKLKEADQDQFL
jgi:hypothetical protein